MPSSSQTKINFPELIRNNNIDELVAYCKSLSESERVAIVNQKLGSKPTYVTPLIYASRMGKEEIFQKLIDFGADPSKTFEEQSTPLHESCFNGNLKITEILLRNSNVDVNKQNKWGMSPLMLASLKGHNEIVNMLIDNGADVNQFSNDRSTALILASTKGRKEVVEILIDKNADINAIDSKNISALLLASNFGHLDIVRILISKQGINVEQNDIHGSTPLILASTNGHAEIVELLIEKGADIEKTNYKNINSLIYSIKNNHFNIVKTLIDHNVNLEFRMNDLRTPLMIAASNSCNEIAKLLINNNVEINKTDSRGNSALGYSILRNNLELFEILISRGADIENCVSFRDPINLIFNKRYTAIINSFLNNYPQLFFENQTFEIIFNATLQHNYKDFLEILLQKNIKIPKNISQEQSLLLVNMLDNINIKSLDLSLIEDFDLKNNILFDNKLPHSSFYKNLNILSIKLIKNDSLLDYEQQKYLIMDKSYDKKDIHYVVLTRILKRNKEINNLKNLKKNLSFDQVKQEWFKNQVDKSDFDIIDFDIMSRMIEYEKYNRFFNIGNYLNYKLQLFLQQRIDKSSIDGVDIEQKAIEIAQNSPNLYEANILDLVNHLSASFSTKEGLLAVDMLENKQFNDFLTDKITKELVEERIYYLIYKLNQADSKEDKMKFGDKIADWAIGINFLRSYNELGMPVSLNVRFFKDNLDYVRDDEINCKLFFYSLLDNISLDHVLIIKESISNKNNQYLPHYQKLEIEKYLSERFESNEASQDSKKRKFSETQLNDLSNLSPNTNFRPISYDDKTMDNSMSLS